MFRGLSFLAVCAALSGLTASVALAASAAEGSTPVRCTGATITTTTATGTTAETIPGGSPPSEAGASCWEEQPYPFGAEGEAVNTSKCAPGVPPGDREALVNCYLTVTSMAFRSWNRGLAATTGASASNPFGVWIFNGTNWYPSPGFPGAKVCQGKTVVWAGKRDYWLIGAERWGEGHWANLCRFDGARFEWDPLEVPKATLERITPLPTASNPKPAPASGEITSAACFAWNDCWFFGTYGTVVHWNGEALTDSSPNRSQALLRGEYTAAVARQGPAGEPLALAVGATSERFRQGKPLQTQTGGSPPPQLYGSSGEAFSPLRFTPITEPPFTTHQINDPYRTDLVAVGLNSAGQGWVAGNPAGLHVGEFEPTTDPSPPSEREFSPSLMPQPSPLLPAPASPSAPTSACKRPSLEEPPLEAFAYTPSTAATAPRGAFLWSSIAVFPAADEALAGGHMRRASAGPGPNEDAAVGEPVIVRVGCDESTTVTRFRIQDPTEPAATAPGDREGSVTAVAANAANDAWTSTNSGALSSNYREPPRLYRLTNGRKPLAPEGDDAEERPLPEPEPPRIPIEPPPPEPPAQPPVTVTHTHSVTLPSALYHVEAKLHKATIHGHLYLSLYLTFRLRRPVTVGAQALRGRRVVSTARPRHFAGRTGLLVLRLDRARWPTKVQFIT